MAATSASLDFLSKTLFENCLQFQGLQNMKWKNAIYFPELDNVFQENVRFVSKFPFYIASVALFACSRTVLIQAVQCAVCSVQFVVCIL